MMETNLHVFFAKNFRMVNFRLWNYFHFLQVCTVCDRCVALFALWQTFGISPKTFVCLHMLAHGLIDLLLIRQCTTLIPRVILSKVARAEKKAFKILSSRTFNLVVDQSVFRLWMILHFLFSTLSFPVILLFWALFLLPVGLSFHHLQRIFNLYSTSKCVSFNTI